MILQCPIFFSGDENKMRLHTLDLFSGIGGMSYALKSQCKTVAYCEVNDSCRECLIENMKRKILDRAPVHKDVTTLRSQDLPSDIEVILAGFPCQDLSTAGKRVGLTGSRSSLFWHIIRLLKDLKNVKYVFLENVPTILLEGADTVTAALRALGFRCSHGVFQANEVGIPHTRKRWFCLANRSVLQRPSNSAHLVVPPARPSPEPRRLLLGRPTSALKKRYTMLGNAVVPQVVALAWNTLAVSATQVVPATRAIHDLSLIHI